ncbi:pre-mRNA 3' end processing protein WDR33 isoform X2 [Anthonomus grandis grandis]|uniref:pre-mRNA 3' end processing protein WDR33 isoform X2 n=1 Tax=Anthonomus grandis grandis TaxID=2921223 RepID=UPI0021668D17|nr:pre-mRNA 3' end processing protein WDR33 isoform X2 [Anthonomus grandis grandis]
MMDFAQPPPNLSMPPPNLGAPPPNMQGPPPQHMGYNHNRQPFRSFFMKPLPGPLGNMTLEDFDGKRLRKSVMRKTVDYNSSVIKELENRIWQRDYRDRRALQPDSMYYPDLMPPPSYLDNPINCVTSRFVKTATNKMRCPIFCMAWTPEGRRLVTGASSGEFTLWNGLTFNFETILQAHDSPVRTMVWSHNDSWMVTGDHVGYVKYWQSNMNNVKVFQAHKEALRGISFSPSDSKFVTCSDDGTLRIWDFLRYQEERVLRGHGADVKCVHWHPQKGLIISGSKDNQQPIKLWDPKTGQSLATLHAHKSTVMDLKWNANGNWLITASRDHLLKLFDLRNLSQEVQTFRGHKKEASSVAWHPVHEGLFASGGSDGAIVFWHVGADKEMGAIEQAHDSIVWTLAWHPLGHILCSGSNDHTSKFWTRNRPGDQMRDKYNLNTLPAGIAGFDDIDIGDELANIPGMGPEDKVELTALIGDENTTIPGLDLDVSLIVNDDKSKPKKVPFSKPIPRNFQAQWNETAGPDNTPGIVPLEKITPNAIIIYGKLIPVEAGSSLEKAISEGPEALQKYIDSGAIEELHDVMPIRDPDEDEYLKDTNHEEIERMHNVSITDAAQFLDTMEEEDPFADEDDVKIVVEDRDMRIFNSKGDNDIRSFNDTDYRNQSMDPRDADFDMRQSFGRRGAGGMPPMRMNLEPPFRGQFRGARTPMGPTDMDIELDRDSPRGFDSPMGGRGRSFGGQRPIMGQGNGGFRGRNDQFDQGPDIQRHEFADDDFGDEDYRNVHSSRGVFDKSEDDYQDKFHDEYYDDGPHNNSWQRNGGQQQQKFRSRGGPGNFNQRSNFNTSPMGGSRGGGDRGPDDDWDSSSNQHDFRGQNRSGRGGGTPRSGRSGGKRGGRGNRGGGRRGGRGRGT